ncbi:MAG: xylS [Paenibacillus sp.]|jgi:alpha-glucosidase (family GH31 glycosyl hydrolase)/AraC-like DNA-binding protein|nr:xylS [Paenibacillus sp.]
MTDRLSRPVQFQLGNGNWMKLSPLSPHAVRLQMDEHGSFKDPATIRFGIIQKTDPIAFETEFTDQTLLVYLENALLEVSRLNGQFRWGFGTQDRALSTSRSPRSEEHGGFGIHFSLADEEKLYGLGDVSREHLQRRGQVIEMHLKNYSAFVPIPFLMSSRGWALLINSTYRHTFDLGYTRSNELNIEGSEGPLDVFLFTGSGYKQLLQAYAELAGKPMLLPIWAYGLTYICHENSNANDVVKDARQFREAGIPCDVIGLSGWTQNKMDFSITRKWNKDRFHIPANNIKSPHTFIGTLQRYGFKLNLNLYCNYDVTLHEHLSSETDVIDRRGNVEPWYAHLEQFVDEGASSFAVSAAWQINGHPGHIWGDGMSDEEMHNVYPVILYKQMQAGFHRQKGERLFIYSTIGYTGIQRFAATCITGKGIQRQEGIAAMLNLGLSGHMHTTSSMDVMSREGIHAGFLTAWSLINSWAYFSHPAYLDEPLLQVFKKYAHLRYRLIPYLYSTAHAALYTGMPMLRAMPLMFPYDPNCDDLAHQYMLGDFLLVAAYDKRVYLPDGTWIDYWTGNTYTGPKLIHYSAPEDAGGALFVRQGAIIPMWPPFDHIRSSAPERLTLHIYPSHSSEFALYEDDGLTSQYQHQKVAVTTISCRSERDTVIVQIGCMCGDYPNMPTKRSYALHIWIDREPIQIRCGRSSQGADNPHPVNEWGYNETAGILELNVDDVTGSQQTVWIELTLPHSPRVKAAAEIQPDHSEKSGLDNPFQALLHTGDIGRILEALQKWWEMHTLQSQGNGAQEMWRVQLLQGCSSMIGHAERIGWPLNQVFGHDLNKAFHLNKIATEEEGYSLLKQYAEHIVRYKQHARKRVKRDAIQQILEIIEQELAEKLSLDEIGKRLYMHPSYLSRMFKKETGLTFSDYILQIRMTRSKSMLESGMKIQEVAALNGFPDAAYFSRTFRKYWGDTPRSYKMKQ